MNNLYHYINQHLYQYIILSDRLRKYSEGIYANRNTPEYDTLARKYDTSLHITLEILDNLPNIKSLARNIAS